MIAGIILAAGASRRMGRPKMEMKLGTKPLLLWAVDAALGSTLDQVFCVVRSDLDRSLLLELEKRKVELLLNPLADLGQSTSLKAALGRLDSKYEAALFLLGDQPFVTSQIIDEVLAVYRETTPRLVAPVGRGEVRNPVLFGRSLFSELEEVSGDQGGREVIRRHASEIVKVSIDDPAFDLDVDTPEDFRELSLKLES